MCNLTRFIAVHIPKKEEPGTQISLCDTFATGSAGDIIYHKKGSIEFLKKKLSTHSVSPRMMIGIN